MTRSTADIRTAFIDYFAKHGHQAVASSSLVPHDDPTLLFTNAGMNQFKDVFLGADKRDYTRAVSSQRCVRAGGKHNDLENVGYTARHHTFFEMLGNFSFGDYFKSEAIRFAWEFLTTELGLPKEKLLVTVFHEDDEAFAIWRDQIGIPEHKIIRIATSDNFWAMGDTGPCGPCSEIFYDHGDHIWGGPPGSPEEDGDRFIEIWNLVFMQFNKQSDGTMQALPKPSIDTGMGLERISAILQNVHSNYEIDLFQRLIQSAAQITTAKDLQDKSLRVIADHIRSCCFLVTDGVMPSNEGRGYVLRRIIRRAVRHGYKLGCDEIFFYRLVQTLVDEMGDAYPELVQQQANIERVLKLEEEQFSNTLARGMGILTEALDGLQGKQIPGELAFKLYDTFGFPVDLTNDVAREQGYEVDQEGFEKAMQKQREMAQAAGKFGADYSKTLKTDVNTDFSGYSQLEDEVEIKQIFIEEREINEASDSIVSLVFERSPFYAESGGQIGDTGTISGDLGTAKVLDTQKVGKAFVHKVDLKGTLRVGDRVSLSVDESRRQAIKLNHSATHLLHAALREVLGSHVSQKGSLVDEDKLRFDFSHFESIPSAQLLEIENKVNEQIRQNHSLQTQMMELEQAKASGAMALFGEKYDDHVRVVTMGAFSTELCGGTHVDATGDIGLFKIISEGGISAGVRRIEAVTGQHAINVMQQDSELLHSLAHLLKSDKGSLLTKLHQQVQTTKTLEKELHAAKQKLAGEQSKGLLDNVTSINGIKVLISELKGVEPKALRSMMDDFKNQLGSAVIALAIRDESKVNLITGVTKDLTSQVNAGDLINFLAAQVGGKGGGRPDMAQAGGTQPENLSKALDSLPAYLAAKLN